MPDKCPMTGNPHKWGEWLCGKACINCGRLKHDAIEPVLKPPPGLKQRIEKRLNEYSPPMMNQPRTDNEIKIADEMRQFHFTEIKHFLTELDKTIAEIKEIILSKAQVCPECDYIYLTETPVKCENSECKRYDKPCVEGFVLRGDVLKALDSKEGA